MRRYRQVVIWMAGALLLQGCVGLGAWTLGSRTESSDHPKIDRTRGVIDVRNGEPERTLKTAAELRAQWGEPDRVESLEGSKEEWIYKTDGMRWSGLVLYVVIVPLPAILPLGSQYVCIFR